MKRVWKITCKRNGFKYFIFVEATADRLHQYIETEIPEAVRIVGARADEVAAAKSFGTPIYMY